LSGDRLIKTAALAAAAAAATPATLMTPSQRLGAGPVLRGHATIRFGFLTVDSIHMCAD